jgi:YesN/AraC family two-component response regulator
MFYYDSELLPQVRLIGKVRYVEPWIHFARCIDEYLIYVIRDGAMFIKENGIHYHLKKNDFFVLEPNKPHEGYEKATCNYYYIHFKSKGIAPIAKEDENAYITEMLEKRRKSIHSYNLDEGNITDSLTCLPKHFTLPDSMEYRPLLQTALDVYNKREEQYKRIASVDVHRFLLNVAHEFLLYKGKVDNSVHVRKSEFIAEQIRSWLNSHYAQKINSKVLEDMFEINFDYINRIFTQITGQTIFNYLNTLRIVQAKELIRTTNLTFTEISYLVGIEDKYYFSRLFKKMTGMTPTEYFKSIH